MAPIIHFVRHAQGYHNLNVANHRLHDPLLTPLGKQQCAELQSRFPYKDSIDLIVASPIKRTVYTALLSFDQLIKEKNLTVIAVPELQETSDYPCDTGSDITELQKEFRGQPVDLSRVVPGWNSKLGRWAPTAKALEQRSRTARRWLRDRDEDQIVVVTHGGVLHYLTEDWDDYIASAGTGWANTEYRSYYFKSDSGNNATLVETEESRNRRLGTEKPLSEAEQRNLKRTTTKEWQSKGFLESDADRVKAKRKTIKTKLKALVEPFVA